MKKFSKFLAEAKEKEKKIVFKETDGRSAYPANTINAIESQITTLAKDLDQDWKSAVELIDKSFEELDIPKPQPYQKERWGQFNDLIAHAIKQLYQSRGLKASWTQSI